MKQSDAQKKVTAFFTYANKGYNEGDTHANLRKYIINAQYKQDELIFTQLTVAQDIINFNAFVQKVIRWTGDSISFEIFQNFYKQQLDQSISGSPLSDTIRQLKALELTE